MAVFRSMYNQQTEEVTLRLDQAFSEKDWGAVIAFYKEKAGRGFKKWRLDLSAMQFISSNSIGMLIAFNTSIMANVGALQVVLAKQSHVTSQIRFAKIDRILNCRAE